MAKTSRIQLAGPRDTHLLFFLWKWKVATTAALTARFFASVAGSTAYRRLWRLEQGGFIASRADRAGRKHVWHLGKRGYEAIRGLLPHTLKEDGYKSEHIGHDLVASTFHLGDFFLELPQGVRMFSEQQVRRFQTEDYPDYISRYSSHVPDGYTRFECGHQKYTVAFETELNPKSQKDYGGLFPSLEYGGPDMVFWLAPKVTTAKRIYRYLGDDGQRRNEPRHSFITFPQFLNKGWGAEIICGMNEGMAMRQVIEKLSQNTLQTASKVVLPRLLLNAAKTPYKSKAYKFFEIGDFAK